MAADAAGSESTIEASAVLKYKNGYHGNRNTSSGGKAAEKGLDRHTHDRFFEKVYEIPSFSQFNMGLSDQIFVISVLTGPVPPWPLR